VRKPSRNLLISPPFVLSAGAKPPRVFARTTISDLCAMAEIRMRATVTDPCVVACVRGRKHLRYGNTYYVGVGDSWIVSRVSALRVLEVLTYGFHDYVARESVCRQNLFSPPRRMGRPANGVHAMTAAERMAAMRARRRVEASPA
jgi:hypothetical protein